jgi:tetratricopeptide (TPR) repeat protein
MGRSLAVLRSFCLNPASARALLELANLWCAEQLHETRVEKNPFVRRLRRLSPDNESFWHPHLAHYSRSWGVSRIAVYLGQTSDDRELIPYAASLATGLLECTYGAITNGIYWLRRAACTDPSRWEALSNLGLLIQSHLHLIETGAETAETSINAITWLQRAVNANPVSEKLYTDLLYAEHRQGVSTSSARLLAMTTGLTDPAALTTVAMVAIESREHSVAIDALNRGLALRPDAFFVYAKRTIFDVLQAHWAACEVDCSRALLLNPDAPEPRINRARAWEGRGDFEKALSDYDAIIGRWPHLIEPKLNAGILRLGLGEFANGWELYEGRWFANNAINLSRQSMSHRITTAKPRFRVGDLGTVLVWAEQGIGDEIMFLSMLPDLLRDADQVIVQADVRLFPLLKRSFPGVTLYKRIRQVDERLYDYQISMGELGGLYRRSVSDFPRQQRAYIRADDSMAAEFRQRLDPEKLKIGVSWLSFNPGNQHQRSIAPRRIFSALGGARRELVSLQAPNNVSGIRKIVSDPGCFSESLDEIDYFKDIDKYNDFDSLAAIIEACDLIVCVGNSTAHLAAALGKPTWVLTPLDGSWRWMYKGATTPWYPSVRVFRQRRAGDWEDVLSDLQQALAKLETETGRC